MADKKGISMNKRNPNNRQREIISTFKSVFEQTSGIDRSINLIEEFLSKQNNNKSRRASR